MVTSSYSVIELEACRQLYRLQGSQKTPPGRSTEDETPKVHRHELQPTGLSTTTECDSNAARLLQLRELPLPQGQLIISNHTSDQNRPTSHPAAANQTIRSTHRQTLCRNGLLFMISQPPLFPPRHLSHCPAAHSYYSAIAPLPCALSTLHTIPL